MFYGQILAPNASAARGYTTKSFSSPDVQILRNLKNAFWPFQHDHTRSLFLWAAHAANCIDGSNIGEERYF
jgi:hypothetical protein